MESKEQGWRSRPQTHSGGRGVPNVDVFYRDETRYWTAAQKAGARKAVIREARELILGVKKLSQMMYIPDRLAKEIVLGIITPEQAARRMSLY